MDAAGRACATIGGTIMERVRRACVCSHDTHNYIMELIAHNRAVDECWRLFVATSRRPDVNTTGCVCVIYCRRAFVCSAHDMTLKLCVRVARNGWTDLPISENTVHVSIFTKVIESLVTFGCQ